MSTKPHTTTTTTPSVHGVIQHGDDYLRYFANDGWHKRERHDSTIVDVLNLAEEAGVTHLWFLPEPRGFFVSPGHLPLFEDDWKLTITWEEDAETGEQRASQMSGYRTGGQPGRYHQYMQCIFLEYSKWEWAHNGFLDPTGAVSLYIKLICLLRQLERELGVAVGSSPAMVYWRLLQQFNAAHPEWLTVDWASAAGEGEIPWAQAAKSLIWKRRLLDSEQGRRFLHKVDVRSAFTRAAAAEKFGAGEIAHLVDAAIEEPDELRKLAKKPGVWRVEYNVLADDFVEIPAPIWPGAEWIASPVLKLCASQGAQMRVLEGYYFEESHSTLERLAQFLWEKRQLFREHDEAGSFHLVRDAAAASIKQIMNEGLGLLRSERVRGQALYRPDIYCQVVGGTWAKMHYNIATWALLGITPCLAYIDALVYVSDAGEIAEALPGIERHMDSLGGYKHEWTLPLVPDVVALLGSDLAPAKIMQQLNAWAADPLWPAAAVVWPAEEEPVYPAEYPGMSDEGDFEDDSDEDYEEPFDVSQDDEEEGEEMIDDGHLE